MEVKPTKEVTSMYNFAVVAFLALGVLAVMDMIEEYVPAIARIHALATFGFAVLAAYALDYSVFSGFHVAVREAWMATWGTGVIIAALGGAWRAVFGYLGSSEAPGAATHRDRPRVAA
jgi:hypothetical protein